jgi:hypothetical protein
MNETLNIKQRVMLRNEFGIIASAQATEKSVIGQVKKSAKLDSVRGATVWHNKVVR